MDRTLQMKQIHDLILQDKNLQKTLNYLNSKSMVQLIDEIKILNENILKYMNITDSSISYINFGNELSNILKNLHLISAFLWIRFSFPTKNNPDEYIIDSFILSTTHQVGLELFERKNQKYGDAFNTYGIIGILIRMGDKIARLLTLSEYILLEKSSDLKFDNESIIDTTIDLNNYSTMALMLIEEKRK